jgi:hypothetical protein
MIEFQDIGQFRQTARSVQHRAQFVRMGDDGAPIMNTLAISPTLPYVGTVKLHGTNGSVRIEGDRITPQSRSNELSATQDNMGFAKFILSLPPEIWQYFRSTYGDNIVVFGEWAGKGVQKTVAISQVDKFWAIFRIERITPEGTGGEWLDLHNLNTTILNTHRIYSIYQFGVYSFDVDFEHPAKSINEINETCLAIEAECPAGKFFGISGIGEGVVLSPQDPAWQSSKYVFKVKGQKHSASKGKKLANVDVEKLANIEAFVEKHMSEERLMQAWHWLAEQGKPQDQVSTGDFIRWIFNDILKEEADELTASGLTAKDLGTVVSKPARNWFFAKINNPTP